MSNIVCNGWNVRFHPIFNQQWNDFLSESARLRNRLSESDYRSHPVVKLFLAVKQGVEENIPADPFAVRFPLRDNLRGYSRLKGMGLPSRYRLFFRAFQQGDQRDIVILWLGYPRREGDKKDCYAVFEKMVSNRLFPESMEELIAACEMEG